MPAFYAHKHFAEEVVRLLPNKIQSIVSAHRSAFVLGTQGPDLLFNYRPFKKTPTRDKALGLHSSKSKAFFMRAHELSKSGSLAINAYMVGFICHFILDNACHPSVYQLEDTGVSHGRIESEFDKYLRKRAGVRVHKNAARELSFKQEAGKVCASILDVQEKEIRRAVRTMRTVNGCFAFPSRCFQRFAHFVLKKAGKEKFFEMFLHYEDLPQMQQLNPILAEKFDQAKSQAAMLVVDFFHPYPQVEFFDAFDKDYKGEPIK